MKEEKKNIFLRRIKTRELIRSSELYCKGSYNQTKQQTRIPLKVERLWKSTKIKQCLWLHSLINKCWAIWGKRTVTKSKTILKRLQVSIPTHVPGSTRSLQWAVNEIFWQTKCLILHFLDFPKRFKSDKNFVESKNVWV